MKRKPIHNSVIWRFVHCRIGADDLIKACGHNQLIVHFLEEPSLREGAEAKAVWLRDGEQIMKKHPDAAAVRQMLAAYGEPEPRQNG